MPRRVWWVACHSSGGGGEWALVIQAPSSAGSRFYWRLQQPSPLFNSRHPLPHPLMTSPGAPLNRSTPASGKEAHHSRR